MNNIRLTVLGSSDAFNSGGRGNSCFWVEDAIGYYLLDFGPTAPLKSHLLNIDLNRVDVLYLTHLHGDHIGGIPTLLIDLTFISQRTRPLLIAGPEGTQDRLEQLYKVTYPGTITERLNFSIHYQEWSLDGMCEVGGRSITSIAAKHDAEAHPTSIAIKTGENTIVFSGDTGWNERLIELSAETNAFVCECSYRDYVFPGHLSLEEIETHRSRLTPKKLILTHFNDQAREAAMEARERLNIQVADDGKVFEL